MYYPDQRYASPLTVIRRECLLPEDAIGTVRITEGKRVDIRDVVANGVMPSRHILIDAAAFFGLSKPAELERLLQVEVGSIVQDRDVLAGKNPKRGKRLFAPVRGIVAGIDKGRIILQEMPELIDLEAGVRGRITRVLPGRGVIIESVGAQIQGVWGNNRRTIATLRVEGEEGLEHLQEEQFDMRFRGAIMLTSFPITQRTLHIMEERGFVGLIAPSFEYHLRSAVLNASGAILLTDGFGSMRMNRSLFNMLAQFENQQVTLDAFMPGRWESRSPEIIVNVPTKGDERVPRPNAMLALRKGMTVRATRDPFIGQTGIVADLPESPILLDNGLRVLCARVELVAGGIYNIPLSNLEVLGR